MVKLKSSRRKFCGRHHDKNPLWNVCVTDDNDMFCVSYGMSVSQKITDMFCLSYGISVSQMITDMFCLS